MNRDRDDQGGMTVVLESTDSSGETARKEFPIGSFTDVRDRYVLLDEDGEGRLMLTADELRDVCGIGSEATEVPIE